MPRLSAVHAGLLAAAAALLVFVPAARNGWAVDDVGVIRSNPAAHSLRAAWEARFAPYWPEDEGRTAGLYRPGVILSYGADWQLADGRPGWFHVHNVLLHALAAALVVWVLARWLPPAGALVAGLAFAVHPVHVEAVANVVGRAELLAAVGILAALLLARAHRSAVGPRRWAWGAATLGAVFLALLAKEHAAVAVVVLALDAHLDPDPEGVERGAGVLIGAAALTVAWLWVWKSVAGPLVADAEAATLRDLTAGQRWATMLPAQLDVVRLLTWPLDLSHDYHPQTVPQRVGLSPLAVLGGVTSGAIVAIGLLAVRRAPAVALGILTAAIAYLPTSNLAFASGVVLAERTLYLAVLAPAAALGWAITRPPSGAARRAAVLALAGLLLVYAGRTVTRTPVWRDSRTVLFQGLVTHPENYRTHYQVARLLDRTGEPARALAEYLVSVALFDRDPFVPLLIAPLAVSSGRPGIALRELERARQLAPDHPAIHRARVETFAALGWADSAVAVAREAVRLVPGSGMAAETYAQALRDLPSPRWRVALADARVAFLDGRLGAAGAALDAAERELAAAASAEDLCPDLAAAAPLYRALRPEGEGRLQEVAGLRGFDCTPDR